MTEEQIKQYCESIPRNNWVNEVLESSERVFIITLDKYRKNLENLGIKEGLYINLITESTEESLRQVNKFKLFCYQEKKSDSDEIRSLVKDLISKDIKLNRTGLFRLAQTFQDKKIDDNMDLIVQIANNSSNPPLFLKLMWAIKIGDVSFLRSSLKPVSDMYFKSKVKPELKDKVISGGTGDISDILRFLKLIGPNGYYTGFEPSSSNFDIITKSNLAGRNFVVKKLALTQKSKASVRFNEQGAKSRLGSGGERIRSTSLDIYLNGKEVNLIKLNLNEQELEALEGGRQTIKKWKPKLQIHVTPDRLLEIPSYIIDLKLGYQLTWGYYDPNNTLENIILYGEVLND